MDIFGKSKLEAFKRDNANSRKPISKFVSAVEAAQWTKSTDVINTFRDATITSSGWIFNTGGNNFRILADIAFTEGFVQVVKVGTHSEYDKWTL